MIYPSSDLYPEILSKNFTTYFFVDLETTGFDSWRNEILTLSIGALDYHSLEEIDSLELNFKPKNLSFWGKGAEEKHGISISEALYFEDKVSSTNKLINFLEKHSKKGPQILVCHAFDMFSRNNFFDVSMLRVHMVKLNLETRFNRAIRFFESTDSYFREASRNGYVKTPDYKLPTLCQIYNIKLNHHEAKSDRVACQELYKIARRLDESSRTLTL